MNRQQTSKGPSFYVGWMKGTLVYNNPLSLEGFMYEDRQIEVSIDMSLLIGYAQNPCPFN